MRPSFEFGDEVRVTRNVRNDGTYPGQPTGALLLRRGSTGFVRDIGTFLQDQIVYSVHFIDTGRVVGCREEELQPAADPWFPSRFEFRDKVVARLALGSSGRVLVEPGEVGEIVRVLKTPAPVPDPASDPVSGPASGLVPSAAPNAPGPEATADHTATPAAAAPSFSYHVYFPDRNTLLVPESALEPAPATLPDREDASPGEASPDDAGAVATQGADADHNPGPGGGSPVPADALVRQRDQISH